MAEYRTPRRGLVRRLNMKFALPGLIGLFIMAFIHDLLPGPIRFYAFASVVITLLLGLVTGQFRVLGIQLAAAKHRHDPEQTLNRRQMAVAVGGIIPTIILAALSTIEGYAFICRFTFFIVVAAGAILLYVLRDNHPPTPPEVQ